MYNICSLLCNLNVIGNSLQKFFFAIAGTKVEQLMFFYIKNYCLNSQAYNVNIIQIRTNG
jgi:hypothetical protein